MQRVVTLLVLGVVAAGCTGSPGERETAPQPSASTTGRTQCPVPLPSPTATHGREPAPRLVRADDLHVDVAVRTVRHLAGNIGPRHATSAAYRRAARWITLELEATGLEVRQQPVHVPGGVSWGGPVGEGRSADVIASAPGFDPTRAPAPARLGRPRHGFACCEGTQPLARRGSKRVQPPAGRS